MPGEPEHCPTRSGGARSVGNRSGSVCHAQPSTSTATRWSGNATSSTTRRPPTTVRKLATQPSTRRRRRALTSRRSPSEYIPGSDCSTSLRAWATPIRPRALASRSRSSAGDVQPRCSERSSRVRAWSPGSVSKQSKIVRARLVTGTPSYSRTSAEGSGHRRTPAVVDLLAAESRQSGLPDAEHAALRPSHPSKPPQPLIKLHPPPSPATHRPRQPHPPPCARPPSLWTTPTIRALLTGSRCQTRPDSGEGSDAA